MSQFEVSAAQDEAEFDRLEAIIKEVKEESGYPNSDFKTPAGKRPRKLSFDEDEEADSSYESEEDQVDLMRIFFEQHKVDVVARISLCRTYANYLVQCLKLQKQ